MVFLRETADAFNDVYECTSFSETSVGYAPRSNKVEAKGGKVRAPQTVRISGIVSGAAILHAQQIVPLVKLSVANNVIWFSERSSGGTVIIWTLFENDNLRPVTLVSTKSYDFAGAVSFTAFYKCK
jgi:hypothetical protein